MLSAVGFGLNRTICVAKVNYVHRCFASKGRPIMIIQPDIKWGPKKDFMSTAEERLAEARGLVEAAGEFYVADTMVVGVKAIQRDSIFTSGVFETVKERVKSTHEQCRQRNEPLTVLFNHPYLNAAQQSTCEFAWQAAVFDRFQLVLLIFARHASSREAQLSCELAETRLIRARLKYIRSAEYQRLLASRTPTSGIYQLVERSGHVGLLTHEATFEEHNKILEEREGKLQAEFEQVRRERLVRHRSRRGSKRAPKVCVVGYTNAGKTALVAALSRDAGVASPDSRMFATLDVTRHAGALPGSHQRVVFVDTVGFVSDMPVELRDAFRATLDDVLDADLVLHVADASHSSLVKQRHTVQRTLDNLAEELASAKHSQADADHEWKMTVLEVFNKADLLDDNARTAVQHKLDNAHLLHNRFVDKTAKSKTQTQTHVLVEKANQELLFVSTVTGDGITALRQRIETLLVAKLGLLRKAFRIALHRQNEYISWFHRHAAVSRIEPDPTRTGCVIVHCLMTELAYDQFTREMQGAARKATAEVNDN